MAAPTISRTGTAQLKSAGTSLACTLTNTSYATGDYVRVTFVMPNASGAISVSGSAGTATLDSWTTLINVQTGGTVVTWLWTAYAKVLAGGTVTSVTISHPSVTPREVEVYIVSGADGTTPVLTSNSGVITIPVGALGQECLNVNANGDGGLASGAATSVTTTSGWVRTLTESTTFGTTGAGAASNVSGSTQAETKTIVSGDVGTTVSFFGAAKQVGQELWQSPAAPTALTPNPVITGMTQAVARSSVW